MIVALDEIPRAPGPCDPSLDWRPVRDHLGTAILVVGAAPGEGFTVSEWEQRQLRQSRRS